MPFILERIFAQLFKNVSRYNSENIMNALMNKVLDFDEFSSFGYVMQFPLKMILNNLELLEDEEVKYVMNIGTHVDFLIFRKIDRSPVLAVEVDGYSFHKKGTRQAERDQLNSSRCLFYEYDLLFLLEKSTVLDGCYSNKWRKHMYNKTAKYEVKNKEELELILNKR